MKVKEKEGRKQKKKLFFFRTILTYVLSTERVLCPEPPSRTGKSAAHEALLMAQRGGYSL